MPKPNHDVVSLDKKTKTSLGITHKGGVTRRQVERHYNVIAAAFDSHGIDSWGTRRRVYHSDGAMTFNSTDPDAAWRANSNDNLRKRPVFGYDLTVTVTVPDINGPDVALGARSICFRAANQHAMASARNLVAPTANAPFAVIAQYKADIAARSKYLLVKHGSRKINGSQVYQCPASVGNLKCSLGASSIKLPATVLPTVLAPKTAAANSVCSKRYTTFQATDLLLSQRELYVSDEWFKSSARRNRIEGLFGNLKNEANENVKRGTIRVRGLIKIGNLVAFGVASANRRLQESYKNHSTTPVKPILGLPKKKSVAPFAQVFASDANSNIVSQAA